MPQQFSRFDGLSDGNSTCRAKIAGLILLSLVTSCAETDDVPPVTRQSAIVFEKRHVEQIRGMYGMAEAAASLSYRQQRAYNFAMLARGAGLAKAARHPYDPENEACLTGYGVARSTGSLSSDSRFTASFHGIFGDDDDTIQVSFGGSGDGQGVFWPDDPNNSTYPSDWEHSTAFRSDVQEENPLLANRLFSLGLDEWAKKVDGETARDALRTDWPFVIDDVQSGSDDYVPGTMYGQGFVAPNTAEHYEGRDVIVLRAVEHSEVPIGELDDVSGAFPLDKPAVFFEQAPFASTEPHAPNGDTPLGLTHLTRWPNKGDSTPSTVRGALVSFSGVTGGATATAEQPTTLCSRGADVIDFDRHSLLPTTLDSISGSSGGAMLSPNRFSTENEPVYRYQLALGVLSGARGSTEDPASRIKNWSEPFQNDTPKERATLITALAENDASVTDRDIHPGGDPSDPIPLVGSDDHPMECAEYDSSSETCLRPADLSPETEIPLDPPDSFVEGADAEERGQFGRRVFCRHESEESPWGLATGFVGGMAFGPDKTIEDGTTMQSAIGSFLMVCAPRSSRPYTENWRFMNWRGGLVFDTLDTFHSSIGWSTLRRGLPIAYEERLRVDKDPETSEVYIRPPSMRNCPPNYYIQGVSFFLRENKVVGLHKLKCDRPVNNTAVGAPKDIWLSSQALAQDGYTMYEEEFSLDQYIGDVDPDSYEEILTFDCGDGNFVMGLETGYDDSGRLTYFRPICTNSP